jgi:Rrf2 family cysteine metabolism transcriptional repressor
MKVSSRAEYGMRALVDLALHYGQGPVQSRDIAARQGLPEAYLNQLMASLRRAGLLISKRGPTGGHTLSRPPGDIRLREAFEVLEGDASPWWCVEVDDPNCAYVDGCGVRPVWMALKVAAENLLNELTLQDISKRPVVASKESHALRGAGALAPKRGRHRQTSVGK